MRLFISLRALFLAWATMALIRSVCHSSGLPGHAGEVIIRSSPGLAKALDQVVSDEAKLADKLAAGEAKIEGNQEKLTEFLQLMDTFEFWFNIVTP